MQHRPARGVSAPSPQPQALSLRRAERGPRPGQEAHGQKPVSVTAAVGIRGRGKENRQFSPLTHLMFSFFRVPSQALVTFVQKHGRAGSGSFCSRLALPTAPPTAPGPDLQPHLLPASLGLWPRPPTPRPWERRALPNLPPGADISARTGFFAR